MEVIVTDRATAGQILTSDNTITHIVSIGTPKVNPPSGFEQHPAKKLRLIFHDVTWDRGEYLAPREKDVIKLIRFFKSALSEGEDIKFLIHCRAGKSRSTAAALILLYLYLNNLEAAHKKLIEIRPIARPNPLMIKFADNLLSCNGKMIHTGKKIIEGLHK